MRHFSQHPNMFSGFTEVNNSPLWLTRMDTNFTVRLKVTECFWHRACETWIQQCYDVLLCTLIWAFWESFSWNISFVDLSCCSTTVTYTTVAIRGILHHCFGYCYRKLQGFVYGVRVCLYFCCYASCALFCKCIFKQEGLLSITWLKLWQ